MNTTNNELQRQARRTARGGFLLILAGVATAVVLPQVGLGTLGGGIALFFVTLGAMAVVYSTIKRALVVAPMEVDDDA